MSQASDLALLVGYVAKEDFNFKSKSIRLTTARFDVEMAKVIEVTRFTELIISVGQLMRKLLQNLGPCEECDPNFGLCTEYDPNFGLCTEYDPKSEYLG